MRQLTLALTALTRLRETAGVAGVDLAAAATLAELAGVDAVRLDVNEALHPACEADVAAVRRAARCFELGMPASQGLLKVALDAQPDRVVLVSETRELAAASGPLDLLARSRPLAPVIRALDETGVSVMASIPPEIEAVKAVHSEGVSGVEFYTGALSDLPPGERARGLERLGDAVRLAAKLRLSVALGGGLDYRGLGDVLEVARAAERLVVGRAALARALLVGLDRALRDLRQRIA